MSAILTLARYFTFWRPSNRGLFALWFIVPALTLLIVGDARAWDGFGHMQVAEIAWGSLDAPLRARAGDLLKLNPQYPHWTAGVPADEQVHVAFVIAATWADYIKGDATYTSDGTDGGNRPPPGPQAGQNIGYTDLFRHKYWHFIDGPFSQDSTTLELSPVPNAQTQIELFRDTLSSSATDDVKSYDLVWLLHLVGDVHQPLHATSQFSASNPHGDAGGNKVHIDCGGCAPTNLHWFWDNAPGEGMIKTCAQIDLPECNPQNVQDAIAAARALPPADVQLASISDETIWINESFLLSQTQVYQPPISAGTATSVLTDGYKSAASDLAKQRVALAGARLGNLIKAALK